MGAWYAVKDGGLVCGQGWGNWYAVKDGDWYVVMDWGLVCSQGCMLKSADKLVTEWVLE